VLLVAAEIALRVHLISASSCTASLATSAFISVLLACAMLSGEGIARADALADAQLLRRSGCGGLMPAQRPLQHVRGLDSAAARWALGQSLSGAALRSSDTADRLEGVHVSASDEEILQALRRSGCAALMRSDVTEIGLYRRGTDTWLVLASLRPHPAIAVSAALMADLPGFAAQVLELVNSARTRGTSCGRRSFAPVAPVRLSSALAAVARGHAVDMAKHAYFEHQDLRGHTPADRVRAAGYREKLVGENIAYGPQSSAEVVRGWLESPGHCENIMDPRFAEMGIAYALGRAPAPASGQGLYWVQLLADPKG